MRRRRRRPALQAREHHHDLGRHARRHRAGARRHRPGPKDAHQRPDQGTILVSVLNGDGPGVAGVSVSAVPTTLPTARDGPAAPAATDAQGCTYVLKVAPGNYDVTVSQVRLRRRRAGGHLQAHRRRGGRHVRGGRLPVRLRRDVHRELRAAATSPFRARSSASPRTDDDVPEHLRRHSCATPARRPPGPGPSSCTRSARVPGVRRVLRGRRPRGLAARHERDGQPIDAGRPVGAAAAPGGTATVDVPMGVVKLALGAAPSERFVRAVSTTSPAAGSGDPGCASDRDVLVRLRRGLRRTAQRERHDRRSRTARGGSSPAPAPRSRTGRPPSSPRR